MKTTKVHIDPAADWQFPHGKLMGLRAIPFTGWVSELGNIGLAEDDMPDDDETDVREIELELWIDEQDDPDTAGIWYITWDDCFLEYTEWDEEYIKTMRYGWAKIYRGDELARRLLKLYYSKYPDMDLTPYSRELLSI
jgi:hypothetical protein